jgi:hypothetical protein
MSEVTKDASFSSIKNIYGINIGDFSDQIIKDGKIQGVAASCGLHLHFSCEELVEVEIEEAQYEHVSIPIEWVMAKQNTAEVAGLNSLARPTLCLYKFLEYKKKKTISARASRLNKPTIEYIVKTLDETFFSRFCPEKDKCTKFRQPGFYELKPYGFEYRSLPANTQVIEALPEIVAKCFKLLAEINS